MHASRIRCQRTALDSLSDWYGAPCARSPRAALHGPEPPESTHKVCQPRLKRIESMWAVEWRGAQRHRCVHRGRDATEARERPPSPRHRSDGWNSENKAVARVSEGHAPRGEESTRPTSDMVTRPPPVNVACPSRTAARRVLRGWVPVRPWISARQHRGPAALALPTRRTLLYLARRSRR